MCDLMMKSHEAFELEEFLRFIAGLLNLVT